MISSFHHPAFLWTTALFALVLLSAASPTAAQLDETCSVSVLNRTAPVNADGVWVLPNIPANFGQVRVRATCVDGTEIRTGQSPFFDVPANGVIEIEEIDFDAVEAIAERLEITAPTLELRSAGETLSLTVNAVYPDQSRADVTAARTGTTYTSSNPRVATVSADGLVTAVASGRVFISATNEGAMRVLELNAVLSGDSDNDGMPDDFELQNGLDPNNPADAFADPDRDSLANLQEFEQGLDPRNPDTDGDTLLDGIEPGTYNTDPRLFDTDGDGLSDGLEARLGSDPTDPSSFALEAAMTALELEPPSVLLTFNTVDGEASRKLRALASLVDETVIDVSAARYGTVFTSNDLGVANFGAENGRVFAGQNGVAIITATLGAFTAQSAVTVESFAPTALAYVPLPGYANGVDADDDYAYVACGSAGLQVVDVSDPAAAKVAAELATPGNANDVRRSGDLALLADGEAGLTVIDVQNPTLPRLLATLALPGTATDLAVDGTLAAVVDELGLRLVDFSDPEEPFLVGGLDTPGRARGVDFQDGWAVIADSAAGVHVVDVGDPTMPRLVGTTATRPNGDSHAADVVIHDHRAFVADGADLALGGLRTIDFRAAGTPVVIGASSDAFGLAGVAQEGDFVLAADYFFVHAVPIFHVGLPRPAFRGVLDFAAAGFPFPDDNGNGIAVRDGLVFVAGALPRILDNGEDRGIGTTGLSIGRYRRPPVGDDGVSPAVSLVAPDPGERLYQRQPLTLRAAASDDVRLAAVIFRADGTVVATDFSPPWSAPFTVPETASQIAFEATAIDAGGNAAASELSTFSVDPNDVPTVELLAPVAGASVREGSTLVLAADASDDVRVERVDFLVDGALAGTRTSPPYRLEHAVPLGVSSLEVSAVASDVSDQSAATPPVSVTVLPDAPPTVVLLRPASGLEAVAGSVLDVVAGAFDDVAVERVRLFAGGALLAELAEPPFAAAFTVPVGAGEIELRAAAVDTLGQVSAPATVRLAVIDDDPGTTVVGTVLDAELRPVAGASVTCLERQASSDFDGTFAVSEVPTSRGDVVCTARFVDAEGMRSSGESQPAAPVRGGVTEVGEIRLEPFVGPLYPLPVEPHLLADPIAALAVGDLDSDGFDDLVYLAQNQVQVRRGRSNGAFTPIAFGFPGWLATDLWLGHFNDDEHLDLVAVGFYAGSLQRFVNVFAGRGDATFEAPLETAVSDSPRKLFVEDLDADGRHDVLALESSRDYVAVLHGTSGGGLELVQALATTDRPDGLAILDLDADGVLDLVVDPASPSLEPLSHRGLGDGTFAAGGGLGLGVAPWVITTADVDDDGRPELLAAVGFENEIQIYRRRTAGGLELTQTLVSGGFVESMVAFDRDDDGVTDLAAVNSDNPDLSLFHGLGGGAFADEERIFTGASQPTREMVPGDFNHDGQPDLAITQGTVTFLYNRGDGTLDSEQRLDTVGTLLDVLPEDFNADGVTDVVAVGAEHLDGGGRRPLVAFFGGRGDGTFRSPAESSAGCCYEYLQSGDLDNDGYRDLVVFDNLVIINPDISHPASILLGQSDGTFEAQTLELDLGLGHVEFGDLDGDGNLDLAAAGNEGLALFPGRGDGTFEAAWRVSLAITSRSIALGDLDGDGRLDVVTNEWDPQTSSRWLKVYPGRGDGTLAEPLAPIPTRASPYDMDLGDLDGDGDLDLVSLTAGPGLGPEIRLGRGDSTFGEVLLLPLDGLPGAAKYVTLADLDANGHLDLALSLDKDVLVYLGRGDGTFEAPQRFAMRGASRPLSTADLNGDGRLDLLRADQESGVSILFQR